MARLEYRLLDEAKGYPVLFFYERISKAEVHRRFACDYLVKGHIVYEKTSAAVEEDCYVIYARHSVEEKAIDYRQTQKTRLGCVQVELREYREGIHEYPLVQTFYFKDGEDALMHLLSDYLYVNGREWEKTSTEVDEDRHVYVIYAQ